MVTLDSLYNQDYVEMTMTFDMNLFPFYPPSVRPVSPRLEDGFVAQIVCLDELLVSNWNPVTTIPDILGSIKRLLSSHGQCMQSAVSSVDIVITTTPFAFCTRSSGPTQPSQ